MEAWIWLIAWTVMLYLFGLYLYRTWQTRRRQKQEYLWGQIGFRPSLSHQAGKTGIAIDTTTGRVALREQNNLGVFEPGDILSYQKGSAPPSEGAGDCYLEIRIKDPRKPDWRVAFGQDEQACDTFYAQLQRARPAGEVPPGGA